MCIFLLLLLLLIAFFFSPRQWVNYTWKNGEGRNKKKKKKGRRKESLWGPAMTVTPTAERSLPRERACVYIKQQQGERKEEVEGRRRRK
jgi:hypothetical protein